MKNIPDDCKGYYDLGDSYFWIAAHCDLVTRFVEPLVKKRENPRETMILDAGCGYGSLISRLKSYGKITGLDTSLDACSFCRNKYAVALTQASAENTPFRDNTFDFVFATEVIEHIRNDGEAMKELYRILKPKGYLIVTVPAFMCLWGHHDEQYGHIRRYTKEKFLKIAAQAGFSVKESHYFKFFLFLPLLALRKAKQIASSKSDDFYKINPFLNFLLHKLLNLEIPLCSIMELPVGANLFTILRKD
ncbi:MAG: class I SAM-dependent methyltransferase [Candidatus Omnitrophica bacterium]|nr:class I SAM-dependent methyltransferase [Candidatus Omnitrophota bacterium]